MSRLSRIKNILGQMNPLDKSVREDFGKAVKQEFGVGAEDQRQVMHAARKAKKLEAEGPKFEQMAAAYRIPQVIKEVFNVPVGRDNFVQIRRDPEYKQAREKLGLQVPNKNVAQKAGALVGAAGADIVQDAARRFWWLLNAPQAVGEIVQEQVVGKAAPQLYQKGEGGKRKYAPGAVQALSIPAGLAINAGIGLMNPVGGSEGYKAVFPDEEDPTKTSNVLGEVASKYFLGRSGNLLPYDEFVKVRPDVSEDEYRRYKAYKHSKAMDYNPTDGDVSLLPLGYLKGTTEGIRGPEVEFMGRSLPVNDTLIPFAGAVTGTALGARFNKKNRILGGLAGGFGGQASGAIIGNIIENERRRRNTVENELEGI